jgi:hypothetical protein
MTLHIPHYLDRYLTEYDDSLSTESYIDPIGTLIIWSAFGRQVFNNRINSISNDVRNYTLNLFNHFLVRKLVDDDAAALSNSLKRHYHRKDALNFKQACLVFLENLFVYSILRHEAIAEVKPAGILGISNARRNWCTAEGNPTIAFTHEPAGQILVRQLSLGVSGRYKTPLMAIGFFDNSYQYHKPAYQPQWDDAEGLVTGKPNSLLGKLEPLAYAFLAKSVSTLHHGGKLQVGDEVQENLTKAYARAFASPRAVGKYVRDFWLRRTGLDEGAAGALLQVLEENPEDLPTQQVFNRALRRELLPAEKGKLEQIAELEPFLSDCALLFTLMAAERTHSIASVAAHWLRFGRDEKRLPSLAKRVTAHASLLAVKGSAAAHRLLQLQHVANAGSLNQQVRALAEYHRNVMQSRGQVSWLTVDDIGTIRVHVRTLPRPKPERWPPDAWYNDYYIPQFRSFVAGMRVGDT